MKMEPIPKKDESEEVKDHLEGGEPSGDQPDGPKEIQEVVGRFHAYQKMLKEALEWIRIVIVCGIAACLILGVIYNFFASAEKDIPDEVFSKMYKFMQAEAAESPNIQPLSAGTFNTGWPHLPRNSSDN